MAKYKTDIIELEDNASLSSLVNLDKVPPNTFLVVVADDKGDKKVLGLDPDAIKPNQAILRNTTDGWCYVLVSGHWVWVPC